MDDDDLRRGRPTCHKAFDDATAILAGDALQALAFKTLAQDRNIRVNDTARLKMIATLTSASGSLGMAGGQAIDLAAEGKSQSLAELENMHALKTGALIRASIRLGALSYPKISEDELETLDRYGRCIGLAFQIQDDILDETGNTEKLGKPQGSDRERNKSTFPALYGLEESKKRAQELLEEAIDSLHAFGDNATSLRQLARYIVQRDY
jgi:farnesyl diphosphate synthase